MIDYENHAVQFLFALEEHMRADALRLRRARAPSRRMALKAAIIEAGRIRQQFLTGLFPTYHSIARDFWPMLMAFERAQPAAAPRAKALSIAPRF